MRTVTLFFFPLFSRRAGYGLLLVTLGLTGLFVLWNLCFGFTAGYLLLLLQGYCLSLLFRRRYRRIWTIIALTAMGYLLGLPLTLAQYQRNSTQIYQKIVHNQSTSLTDRLAIYGLNLMLAAGGAPLFPEIALETFLMCFPDSDGVRYFEDDFFLASQQMQRAIRTGKSRVAWPPYHLLIRKEELRVALTLNPCELSKRTVAGGTEYQAAVMASYPKQSQTIILQSPLRITVEEGLFWHLQEIGWLHPYKAIWRTTVPRKITEG